MTEAITIDDIRAARDRLAGVARVTPMLESPFLNRLAGRRVLVKAECLQRTGSFKFRGGWSAVSVLPEAARERGVIAYSSGNHAQGVAHAAELMGVPAVIVMPRDAPALKLANTRAQPASRSRAVRMSSMVIASVMSHVSPENRRSRPPPPPRRETAHGPASPPSR